MLLNEQLAAACSDDSLQLWIPPVVRELDGMDAKKERFLAALEEWTTAAKARRERDAADRKAFKGIDRLHAHRRAELEGMVRYCRENPRADATLALFSLIILHSDNDDYGACYLSIPRMAEALSRTPDSIRAAIDRLIEAGLIGSEERSGGTTLHWPLVHQSFGDKASLHWLVEHYSPVRRAGRRPNKPLRPEPEGVSDNLPANPLGPDPRGFSAVSENPSGPDRQTPQARTRDDSSNDLAKKRESGAAAPAPPLEHDLAENGKDQGTSSAASSSSDPASPSSGAAADQPDPRHAPPRAAQPTKSDKQGTRLPDHWTLPDEWRDWALSTFNVTPAQVGFEAEKFRDHWCAQPGQKGRKTHWVATWRNWCRNSKGFTPRTNGSARAASDEGLLPPETCRQLFRIYPVKHLRDWRRDVLGPPPGEPGCRVPPEVYSELGCFLNTGAGA